MSEPKQWMGLAGIGTAIAGFAARLRHRSDRPDPSERQPDQQPMSEGQPDQQPMSEDQPGGKPAWQAISSDARAPLAE